MSNLHGRDISKYTSRKNWILSSLIFAVACMAIVLTLKEYDSFLDRDINHFQIESQKLEGRLKDLSWIEEFLKDSFRYTKTRDVDSFKSLQKPEDLLLRQEYDHDLKFLLSVEEISDQVFPSLRKKYEEQMDRLKSELLGEYRSIQSHQVKAYEAANPLRGTVILFLCLIGALLLYLGQGHRLTQITQFIESIQQDQIGLTSLVPQMVPQADRKTTSLLSILNGKITELREAHGSLEKSLEDTRAQANILRSENDGLYGLLMKMPLGMAAVSSDGTICYLNDLMRQSLALEGRKNLYDRFSELQILIGEMTDEKPFHLKLFHRSFQLFRFKAHAGLDFWALKEEAKAPDLSIALLCIQKLESELAQQGIKSEAIVSLLNFFEELMTPEAKERYCDLSLEIEGIVEKLSPHIQAKQLQVDWDSKDSLYIPEKYLSMVEDFLTTLMKSIPVASGTTQGPRKILISLKYIRGQAVVNVSSKKWQRAFKVQAVQIQPNIDAKSTVKIKDAWSREKSSQLSMNSSSIGLSS